MVTGTRIHRDGNRVVVPGVFGLHEVRRCLAAIHHATTRAGYQDLVLDFAPCTAAYPGAMLTVIALVAKLRREDIDTVVVLPDASRLHTLFRNTGWAHLIDPASHDETRYRGYSHVPTVNFSAPSEQKHAVDKMVDAVLSAMPDLARADLAAIEWALQEITDNVLNHADSDVGGFVQLNNLRTRRLVEFTVADSGLGIPTTIRQGHPELRHDSETLDRAVREGVTRNREAGQGNGLFGTLEVAQVGKGYLHVHSGYAAFDYEKQLRTQSVQIPLKGTVVVASLDVSNPDALGAALRLGGERYEPTDYIEAHFELPDANVIAFKLAEEATSFGSRIAGASTRTKLGNLLTMNPGYRIVVDFTDVPMVSSSFADEVFGKLFLEIGASQFIATVDFQGLSPMVRSILDRAIVQRSTDAP